jgi:hypothetical protein
MAARKSVKSVKSAKKAPTSRAKAKLKDLPVVKASKVVGGLTTVDL